MGVDVSGRWDGERPDARGVSRARALRRTQTVAERRLWEVLRKRKLGIRRQAPMGPYVVDFVCHAARLVIEIDGYYHGSDDARRKDAERDAWLRARGYRVIRFPEKEVRERLPEIAERIAAEASTPAPDPSPLKGEGDSL